MESELWRLSLLMRRSWHFAEASGEDSADVFEKTMAEWVSTAVRCAVSMGAQAGAIQRLRTFTAVEYAAGYTRILISRSML